MSFWWENTMCTICMYFNRCTMELLTKRWNYLINVLFCLWIGIQSWGSNEVINQSPFSLIILYCSRHVKNRHSIQLNKSMPESNWRWNTQILRGLSAHKLHRSLVPFNLSNWQLIRKRSSPAPGSESDFTDPSATFFNLPRSLLSRYEHICVRVSLWDPTIAVL